jgi:hypothetical protein
MSHVKTRLFVLSLIVCGLVFGATGLVLGQSVNSGTVEGTVVDETGAVIVGAKVEIKNPISGYDQVQQTDPTGKFRFTNIPFNNYHLEATLPGFTTAQQDVNVNAECRIWRQNEPGREYDHAFRVGAVEADRQPSHPL